MSNLDEKISIITDADAEAVTYIVTKIGERLSNLISSSATEQTLTEANHIASITIKEALLSRPYCDTSKYWAKCRFEGGGHKLVLQLSPFMEKVLMKAISDMPAKKVSSNGI